MGAMASRRNENLNLNVNREVAKSFREVVSRYDNRLGLCATAGLLMFLRADPVEQAKFIRMVQEAELLDQVQEMLRFIKDEQLAAVRDREAFDARRPKSKP